MPTAARGGLALGSVALLRLVRRGRAGRGLPKARARRGERRTRRRLDMNRSNSAANASASRAART